MSHRPHLNIAVVDDDESLCRSLGRLLRASGMQPVSYGSAESFLADSQHAHFDCLVLDIELGGMSGLELARLLNEQGSVVPFLFITAHDDEASRAMAMGLGARAWFRKNDPGADVLDAILRAAGNAAS
ncbi:response regulator [Variovorax sp. J22P168]|uniref:response regulator transcription factor n=1 Tax=Variovorax jilinensis TaxID=3053513 RepID=UPI00257595AC|nr:response regulator [Variovorax sp. J22P168]MDM0012180.1 response regulator [Variovorax sp. J22P168]